MAELKGEELVLSIKADVQEALKGLKAVNRELRETVQLLKQVGEQCEKLKADWETLGKINLVTGIPLKPIPVKPIPVKPIPDSKW